MITANCRRSFAILLLFIAISINDILSVDQPVATMFIVKSFSEYLEIFFKCTIY